MEGIEPSTFVLLRPLLKNGHFVGTEGIEPSTSVLSGQRSTSPRYTWAVGNEGIEPSTSVLSGQRSTTELIAQV